MDSSQSKVTQILAALRTPSRTSRRAAKPARMGCEALEGRQLLTGGASLPGAIPQAGKVEPVEIQPGSIEPGVNPAEATDVNIGYFHCFLSDIPSAPGATGSMTTMPFYHAGGPIELGSGGPDQAATLGPATSSLVPGSGDFAIPGDFFATRGGVAMDAAAPQVFRMMAPLGDPDSGGVSSGAAQGLDVGGDATDVTTRVAPVLFSAVRADLAAIDAASVIAPDEATATTLRADSAAIAVADVPADHLLATVRADGTAVRPGEAVPHALADGMPADGLAIGTAAGSARDVRLLAMDPAADPAFRDPLIQTFRGAGEPATSGLAMPSVAEAANLTLDPTEVIPADVPAVASEIAPTDDRLMATTGVAPVDVRTVMTAAPSRNAIKYRGAGQVVKQAAKALNKGPGVVARGGKVNRLRFLGAARRGGMKLS